MARKTKAETEQTRRLIIDAARRIFAERGVSHTSLEQIAAAANVTRGAIYWHFANKAEIFVALRNDVVLPLLEQLEAGICDAGQCKDPLAAIEQFLSAMIDRLDNDPATRQTFEVMLFKCEYTGDFGETLKEIVGKTHQIEMHLLATYEAAAKCGQLRPECAPAVLARDTYAFLLGIVRLRVGNSEDTPISAAIPRMIRDHIALRRR